jgi:hypothetical protein
MTRQKLGKRWNLDGFREASADFRQPPSYSEGLIDVDPDLRQLVMAALDQNSRLC